MTDGAYEQKQPEADDFGVSAVRELLQLLSQTDITEIKIERGGSRLHIKRGFQVAAPAPIATSYTTTVSTPTPETFSIARRRRP